MKANELMVGDWVYCEGQPTPENVTIQTIAEDGVWFDGPNYEGAASYDRIFPIHITPEILEKNGFRKTSISWIIRDGFIGITFQFLKGKWSFSCRNEIQKKDEIGRADLVSIHRDWCSVIYVHELQHAIRLCGIDKEIVV